MGTLPLSLFIQKFGMGSVTLRALSEMILDGPVQSTASSLLRPLCSFPPPSTLDSMLYSLQEFYRYIQFASTGGLLLTDRLMGCLGHSDVTVLPGYRPDLLPMGNREGGRGVYRHFVLSLPALCYLHNAGIRYLMQLAMNEMHWQGPCATPLGDDEETTTFTAPCPWSSSCCSSSSITTTRNTKGQFPLASWNESIEEKDTCPGTQESPTGGF
jgi:hypothetical protein